MSTKLSIKFKAAATDALRYWLAIDNDDLVITNGEATVELLEGVECVLVWWTVGNAGDTLAVVGKAGEREVVNVKESKIPTGASKGAGYRRFTP